MVKNDKTGEIRQAVEISITDGINRGRISVKRDAAALEMLRYMANELDSADSAKVLRIIPPATFLNFCEKLGLLPETDKKEGKPADEPSRLQSIVGNSKWKMKG